MKKIAIILSIIWLAQWSVAQEDSKIEINGFARNYIGVLLNDSHGFSIIQNTLNLELKKQNDKIGYYANPYVFQYPKGGFEFGMRELYVDFFSDKFDIRLGKQQIIWGQADGVFITDIVSPKDLTEFLLRDFNEIRMGVNAIKANYYFTDIQSLELVIIPNFQGTKLPEIGSIWRPVKTFPAPINFDYSKSDVPLTMENSELFARYNINASWIDLQVIGGYTWDDDPSLHLSKIIDPSTMTLKEIIIQPQYHRLSLAGMSFSSDVAGFILRGEGAYYWGKNFQTSDPMIGDALTEKEYINYVVGLDKTLGDWRLSGQFIQKIILNHNEFIEEDEQDNLATLLISKSMFREKVRVEWFTYFGLNQKDLFSRIRAFYYPYDAMSIEVGSNLFFGDKGIFGQYDNNDMLYTRIKYSF